MIKKFTTIVFLLALFPKIFAGNLLAITNGGLGVLPANPHADQPHSDEIFIYDISAGSSLLDELLLTNSTDSVEEVLVYSTDPVINNDGQLSCEQYVEPKDEEGSWIQINKEDYSLEPQTETKVKFRVTIPEDAEIGEHNACIVLQKKDNRITDSNEGITLRVRVATRVIINIPGDIEISAKVKAFEHLVEDKLIHVNTQIENTGNVSVNGDLIMKYQLFGAYPVGKLQEEVSIVRGSVLSKEMIVERKPYGGFYKAILEYRYEDNDNKLHTITWSKWYWIWPSWWVWAILVGSGLVISYKIRKFRKKKSTK